MPAGWITFTMEGSSSVVSTFFYPTRHTHKHTCEDSLYHNIVSLTRTTDPNPNLNPIIICPLSVLGLHYVIQTTTHTHTLLEKQSSLTSLTLWCKLCVCVRACLAELQHDDSVSATLSLFLTGKQPIRTRQPALPAAMELSPFLFSFLSFFFSLLSSRRSRSCGQEYLFCQRMLIFLKYSE